MVGDDDEQTNEKTNIMSLMLDSCKDLVENIVVYSVSKHCPQRNEFVQRILGLEDEEAKMYLMQIVQEKLAIVEEEYSALAEQIEYENKSNSDSSEICQQCVVLHSKFEALEKNSSKAIDQVQSELAKVRQQLAEESAKVMDNEMIIVEKESNLFTLKQSLNEVDEKMKQLNEIWSLKTQLEAQVANLHDELDLVRPKAAKFDQVEENMMKLREKLEELSEVKKQLQEEIDSHSKTYETLANLEQEAKELRKLKPQIEQYREELAEINITCDELKIKLDNKERALQHWQSIAKSTENSTETQLQQHQKLLQELDEAREQLRDAGRGPGLGQGISEFNPALMQELQQLRAENSELLSKLEETSVEALDRLTKQLADQKSVNGNLQQKWVSTKDELEEVTRERNELAASLRDTEQQLAIMIAQVEDLTAKNHDLTTQLTTTTEQLNETSTELAEVSRKRKQEQIEYETTIEDMQQRHSQEVTTLNEEHTQRLFSATEQLHRQLEMEAEKLEQEVNKRRRVERMKKVLEADCQRYKLQSQGAINEGGVNMSTGNSTVNINAQGQQDLLALLQSHGGSLSDIAAAAREIREMQGQLDASHEELTMLKQQLACYQLSSNNTDVRSRDTENVPPNQANQAQTQSTSTAPVKSSLLRQQPQRILQSSSQLNATNSNTASSNNSTKNAASNNQGMQSYFEQVEINDKRVQQLTREKREILSKALEDSKEKMELQQKVAQMEKEGQQLKQEMRQLTLEKERLERRMMISTQSHN